MYVQVKSSNGITLIPEDTRLLADRRILIDGEINSELACGFMKRIILLSKENEQAISVIVNSPGGEVNSGLMIYDIIQSSHVPIKCTARDAPTAWQHFCLQAASMEDICFHMQN